MSILFTGCQERRSEVAVSELHKSNIPNNLSDIYRVLSDLVHTTIGQ
jgi:hypothetical protein